MKLSGIDFLILLSYTAFVVGIGLWLKDRMKTSEDFLTAGHSLPAWITGISFMAAQKTGAGPRSVKQTSRGSIGS